jgi:Flp pilus assembly protein TadD
MISSKVKQLKSALKGSNQTKTQTSSQPAAADDIGGLSKGDIPVLLSRARSAMGAGRYEDARNAYRKILQLQPDNQEAEDGLHRIDLIRQNDNR